MWYLFSFISIFNRNSVYLQKEKSLSKKRARCQRNLRINCRRSGSPFRCCYCLSVCGSTAWNSFLPEQSLCYAIWELSSAGILQNRKTTNTQSQIISYIRYTLKSSHKVLFLPICSTTDLKYSPYREIKHPFLS